MEDLNSISKLKESISSQMEIEFSYKGKLYLLEPVLR